MKSKSQGLAVPGRYLSLPLLAVVFSTCANEAAAQWLQWGGPHQDFKVDSTDLAEEWPEQGPKQLWKRDLGDGYSAILVDGGRLYTMYRKNDLETVIALDAKTGDTIWEHGYEAAPAKGHEAQFGTGPRSTPLISGDRLYTIGISGRMHCLNKHDGKVHWSCDLWKDFDGNTLRHGYSSSPVEFENTVIVLAGGHGASVIAFDKKDGRVVWKSQDFENSYSTPKLIDVGGQPQLVTFMDSEIIGVDPRSGALEWKYDFDGTNMAQPIWNADERILFLSALGVGARGLKLTRKGDKTDLEEVWSTRKIQFYHVNPIAVGDYVYGSSGGGPNFFAAINMVTGKIAWRKRGFSKATSVYAGGRFYILDEEGTLGLVTATPEEFVVHAKVPLLERVAWTVPTIVGKQMYVRDKTSIRALDLG